MLHTRLTPAGFVEPCQPSPVQTPPAGVDCCTRSKHDGFRLMVRRSASGVRIKTRNGYETDRFPLIVEASERLGIRRRVLPAHPGPKIAKNRGVDRI